jgi:hypothetical protein
MNKKNEITGTVLKKGAFTARAKAAGKSVREYAAEESGAPGKLGKQARLAQTFEKIAAGRKGK